MGIEHNYICLETVMRSNTLVVTITDGAACLNCSLCSFLLGSWEWVPKIGISESLRRQAASWATSTSQILGTNTNHGCQLPGSLQAAARTPWAGEVPGLLLPLRPPSLWDKVPPVNNHLGHRYWIADGRGTVIADSPAGLRLSIGRWCCSHEHFESRGFHRRCKAGTAQRSRIGKGICFIQDHQIRNSCWKRSS